ncbi:dihydrofolate reductase family protein [Allocoleopsis franciscana]|uniref:Dihydrofolate reductase n=1 Tax=Allocoleopsis franciscana PCC 7113 TaxID=1173027 RepID=K9WEC9_9CYAN|nr:dihydrofolate reductase family protein [Allocoleopsis franciscana]AFZ17897.1 dihydrofolate reductase [Allocoleopsis franciscana PCC 7113]
MIVAEYILQVATSVDGYIARLNGSIDWLPVPEEGGEDYGYTKFFNSIEALVMGSTTYEQVLDFGDWPYPGKFSYVLTSRNLSTTRTDVYFVKGGVEEVVEDVKKKGYKRVWLVGGGKVAASFMEQGLVSEYIIGVIPIILGAGISLYQSVPEQNLDLIETNAYSSGVVGLRYRKR